MKHPFRLKIAACSAIMITSAAAQPARAEVGWSKQEIVTYVEKIAGQLPHDTGLASRVVDTCEPQFDRYSPVWRRKHPSDPQRHLNIETGNFILGWVGSGFNPDYPPIAEAVRQAGQLTDSIRERREELRQHPNRTMIPDMIVEFEKDRCIREVVARMPVTAMGSASAGRTSPTSARLAVPSQKAIDDAVEAEIVRESAAIAARYPKIRPCDWRSGAIQPPCVKNNVQSGYFTAVAVLALLETRRRRMSEQLYADSKRNWEKVRSANLDACAKLTATTTPCGTPVADSAYGKKSRIIARDGRHAMACVKLVDLASGNSSVSGGGRVLSNQCSGPVEVAWCSMSGECQRNAGNMWTIQPGRSWPVDREHEIRWGACHGANTIHGDPDSNGTRFTCSKPSK